MNASESAAPNARPAAQRFDLGVARSNEKSFMRLSPFEKKRRPAFFQGHRSRRIESPDRPGAPTPNRRSCAESEVPKTRRRLSPRTIVRYLNHRTSPRALSSTWYLPTSTDTPASLLQRAQ